MFKHVSPAIIDQTNFILPKRQHPLSHSGFGGVGSCSSDLVSALVRGLDREECGSDQLVAS